ncbi:hypothetical protein [Zavarzinella formosa]|uniref:hypothetical protein n=1 Tax=Zavarzinella formosa TaxID=360055 RepID=UPI0002ED8B60|nr:hypothetical protein [Zavarzinella formosa]
MNALYHAAILEGYLSQHGDLPKKAQEAIEFFKNSVIPAPLPAKTKRKLSPETRLKLSEQCKRMQEIRAQKKREQAGSPQTA